MLKKKKKKKKAWSNSHLLLLWRKAILKKYDNRCVLCNNGNVPELECHHIVKRRNKILRYDVKNGVPVCKYGCHQKIDSLEGIEFLNNFIDFEYLKRYENMTYKDYLWQNLLTDNEFLKECAENLKELL